MSTFPRLSIFKGFILIGMILTLILPACTLGTRSIESIPTVDPDATDETKALFIKLWTLSDSNQTLFGHQDDTFFGVGWVGAPGRSDVLEVTGSYPAVYGWEVGDLELGNTVNLDGVPFDRMREEIIAAYRRGGVITISWHMNNPVTYEDIGVVPPTQENPHPGRSWDRTRAVLTVLPGFENHDLYLSWLDAFADFANSLTVSGVPWKEEEHLVPIIFRPFHEHNGSVFWWGGENTNRGEYISLWRFTVEYLRETAGVHNLLYAYSPDARFMQGRNSDLTWPDVDAFKTAYFYAYPGDEYVDVLGLDYYVNAYPFRRGVDDALYKLTGFQSSLDMLVETSHDRSDLKIPALTETGGQLWNEPNSELWWTEFLYRGLIGTRSSGGQLAWALTWRNSNATEHAATFPGQGEMVEENFVEFKNRPMIHFEDEIPFDLYTWPD